MRLTLLKSLPATALATALLAGCVASPAPVTDMSAPQAGPLSAGGPDTFPDSLGEVKLRSKDRISVRVLRETDLSLDDVRIDEDGQFDMPYIGRVQAEGRTASEVAADVAARLGRDYLRNPRVSVNIVDFASNMVTVEGAVSQPGVYQFQPDTTLLGAVAMARGPIRTAKLKQVAIFRTVRGERSVAVFDLSQVRSGAMVDPAIVAGDRILIGFDGLTQAWQDFLQASPLIATFTRI